MKIRPVGTVFFHVDESTDTTKISQLFAIFYSRLYLKCSYTSCCKNTLSDTKKLTAAGPIAA